MPLSRAMAAAAALLLAACGDPAGPTVSAPERGIEGMWLRVHAPDPAGEPAATYPAYADTLFFYAGLGQPLGLWSRSTTTLDGAGQPMTVRSCALVSYAVTAPRLLLTVADPVPATLGTCPVPFASRVLGDRAALPAAPVALTAGVRRPGYAVLRQGRDRLLVRPLTENPEILARQTFWFRRLPPSIVYTPQQSRSTP